MKSKIAVLFYFVISLYIYINREEYKETYLKSDPGGYYVYLPAAFIYHDLLYMDFYKKINETYQLNGNNDRYGVYDNPNGKRTDKYAIGTSLFELPFFLVAHLYCQFDHRHPDDGFSRPFQVMVPLSSIFWAAFGILLLQMFLRRHFGDGITATTLLAICFGTTIYYYSAFNPCSSHPNSFFILAALMYYTDLWYAKLKGKYLYMIGIFLGLAIITRPINIAFALFPMLWMVDSFKVLRERIKLFINYRNNLVIASLLFLAVSVIQMSYWYCTTGHWIYYSYVGEGFDFAHPHIWDGLFSWRIGWFIYTPMALVGIYGLLFLGRKNRKMVIAPLLVLAILIYIDFSWHMWWYGGGFGPRPLVEVLPVLSLPLAAFISHTFSLDNVLLKIERILLISFFVVLNLFQTYQYSLNILFYDRMTAEYYWHIFGKIKINQDESQKLLAPY